MGKQVIVYTLDGLLHIVEPTEEALTLIGIEGVARKDVPAGLPYAILDASDLPADKTFRAAWEVDEAALVDGAGAQYGAGTSLDVIAYAEGVRLVRDAETGEIYEVAA